MIYITQNVYILQLDETNIKIAEVSLNNKLNKLIYLLFAVWTFQGELKHLVDITETRCIECAWVWVSVKETYWRNHSNNSNNNNNK